MPRISSPFKESYHKTIVDQCFEPLTTRFYNQQFDGAMFPSLYGNLVEGTLAEKLEALIGIHEILEKNPALLAHTPKTTLLMKTIIILKERQFPQHVFEAIRVINLLINNQANAIQLIQAGGYVILMDVMTLEPQNLMIMVALWTCCKLKLYENQHFGFQSSPKTKNINLVNKAIDRYNDSGREPIDELIQMCQNLDQYHTYILPKHFSFLTVAITDYVFKVKIQNQQKVERALSFISRGSQSQVSQLIQNRECKEYEDFLHNLTKVPLEILVHYAEFVCESIQGRKFPKMAYFFYSKQEAIKIFEPLFQSTYNLQKEMFINYLITIFKCQKRVAINYFKKRPEMVTIFFDLMRTKISDKKLNPQGQCKSRRSGLRKSTASIILCRTLQLLYYLLCSDFLFYWPLYKKNQYLKTTLEIAIMESEWSIAYEVLANQLYMLNKFDGQEFAVELGKLDKQGLRAIMDKLKKRPEIEMEINFLKEYLELSLQ